MNKHALEKFQNTSIQHSCMKQPRSRKSLCFRRLSRVLCVFCAAAVLILPLTSCASAAGASVQLTGNGAEAGSENSADQSDQKKEEKKENAWKKHLRRADIIFFGSLPFTYTVSQIGVSIYENIEQDSSPFSSISFTAESFSKRTLTATVSLSAAFSLADFIIEQSKQENDE